jgi:hypothetical protein
MLALLEMLLPQARSGNQCQKLNHIMQETEQRYADYRLSCNDTNPLLPFPLVVLFSQMRF